MKIMAKTISLGLLISTSGAIAKTDIYPFVPFSKEEILSKSMSFSETEGSNFTSNIFDIENQGLNVGGTFTEVDGELKPNQPWMSTFWPLNQGMIGSWFTHKNPYNPVNTRRGVDWKKNYKRFVKRKRTVHKKLFKLKSNGKPYYTSSFLRGLAPSEKYDMLLGDQSFDLTNRVWKYMRKWGYYKEYGFLSSLNKVGGESLQMAQTLVDQGKYPNIVEAIPEAIKLRGGLAEHIAMKLVKRGRFPDFISALPTATEKAIRKQSRYVLKKKNTRMALWEGICHGWATAAGIVPRPKKSLEFKLPDGRKLKFYPDDLKALASLLWANSLIQDGKFEPKDQSGNNLIDEKGNKALVGGIIMQGLRCNEKRPKKDAYGRFYDSKPDAFSKKLEPRCVGVHPAIWHIGLVNVMGKQGRSFIVERKIKAAVDNHPLSKYKIEYFNPYNGNYGPLSESIREIKTSDQFYKYRHPETKLIVGVRLTMSYTAWNRPTRLLTDRYQNDEIKDIPMLYDLELDSDGEIIGGQWRAIETGKPFLRLGGKRTQPDFFWTVTKHWKRAGEIKGQSKAYFAENDQVTKWEDTTVAPPSDWKNAAKVAHSFMYQKSQDLGWNEKCEIVRKRGRGPVIEVPCEYSINRPQPFINVVNKLIELSSK